MPDDHGASKELFGVDGQGRIFIRETVAASPADPPATPGASAPVTIAEFLEGLPEFGKVPSGAIRFQLDLAMKSQNRGEWGMYWREAVKLMAAHVLALKYNVAEAAAELGRMNPYMTGFATSQSVSPGSMSVSSSLPVGALGDDPFAAWMYRTGYGQEWLALLVMVIPPCGVVNSAPVVGNVSRFYADLVGTRGDMTP